MALSSNLKLLAVPLAFALAAPALAQPGPQLTRKASMGIALEQTEGGTRIRSVTADLTAARAGLQAGDILTALNGAPTATPAATVALVNAIRAGQPVRFTVTRNGRTITARANALPRPQETYEGATAHYGAVPFRGGLLRDILVSPANAAPDGPVVFLIQGYFCATMEGSSPAHPYTALAQQLASRGIATYRVEKPGMGDSLGTPACLDTDFDTELEAFRAGLDALIRTHQIAPQRIVVLGHSMGGIQAPLLAAETGNLRGVAVMGTAVRSWHDYMIELIRVQGFFSAGADPAESEALSETMRPLFDRIFNEATPLTTIAAENADHARLLREVLDWDGADQILFRKVTYWRQIADQRLAAAWRDSDVPVLALYGEADFAAIDDRDHRLITEIVNHYRPSTARFVLLPRTGHGFGLEGTRAEAQAANRAAGGQAAPAPFNPEVARVLADWIDGLPPG
jgi:hypothetical protein